MLESERDFRDVEARGVLQEDSLALQMHEEFSAAEVLQDEVEFTLRLESVDEVDDERVLHLLQDVPLGLGVSGIFLVSGNRGDVSFSDRSSRWEALRSFT